MRLAAADDLTMRHGTGHWSTVSTLATTKKHIAANIVHVARTDRVVGTFTLSQRKIAFYRKAWFAFPDAASLYLTNMAVDPAFQRTGIGRAIMVQIEHLARERSCRAIRFDAYDGPAGAGRFYEKCGYTCVHRGSVNDVALEYFEKVLR